MKRIISSLAAVAVLAGAAPALAGTVVTPASSTVTFQGPVSVSQSTTLNCILTLSATVDAGGNATITGGSLANASGSFLCPSVGLSFSPAWGVNATAPATIGADATALQITNFRANTLTGNCSGNLNVGWNAATRQITIASSVPGTSLGSSRPCTINGTLTANNPATTIKIAP